jgi:hypothetical protein
MNKLTRKHVRLLTAVLTGLAVVIANQSWQGPSPSLAVVSDTATIHAQQKGKGGSNQGGAEPERVQPLGP